LEETRQVPTANAAMAARVSRWVREVKLVMTFLLLISSVRRGACTHVLCMSPRGSHCPKELGGGFTLALHVLQSPVQSMFLAANAALGRCVSLWPVRDRKTAPNEIAAAPDTRPHAPLPDRGAARLRDHRDVVAHVSAALHRPRPADYAGPRAGRGSAGVLASASVDVRAF